MSNRRKPLNMGRDELFATRMMTKLVAMSDRTFDEWILAVINARAVQGSARAKEMMDDYAVTRGEPYED